MISNCNTTFFVLKKIFFLIGISTFCNSCCTKKSCDGVDEINEVRLYNFSIEESDSVIITSYQKSTNSLVDSFFDSARYLSESTDLVIITSKFINTNLDYKFNFLSINKSYYLTQFTTTKEECNSCFPWGHTFTDVIQSYYVNNQIQNSLSIKIYK